MSELAVNPELDAKVAQCFDLPSGPYSSDIAAAWLVVEAMRARGYSFEVGCNPDRKKTGYESTFWEPYEKGKMVRMWEAEADLPEAICRAALKALEVADA